MRELPAKFPPRDYKRPKPRGRDVFFFLLSFIGVFLSAMILLDLWTGIVAA